MFTPTHPPFRARAYARDTLNGAPPRPPRPAATAAAASATSLPQSTPPTPRTPAPTRRQQHQRQTRVGEPDGSDTDNSSGADEWTDDGSESPSDHEDEELRWSQPAQWDRLCRHDPIMQQLGSLVWKVPADRTHVPTDTRTGPQQNCEFEVHVEDGDYGALFFDALPVRSFFKRICASQSRLYFKQQQRASPSSGKHIIRLTCTHHTTDT